MQELGSDTQRSKISAELPALELEEYKRMVDFIIEIVSEQE